MSRKKVVSVIKTKEIQYGYEPYPIKEPKQVQQPPATVPVQQYVKKQKPSRFGGLWRKKPKSATEQTADELDEAADILEGR